MDESPPARVDSLTGLRFWAALHVLLFHAMAARDGIAGRILRVGPLSVGLFFVLSGFILAFIYLRRERFDTRSFWGARFARVYPIYLLGLVLTLIVYALPHPPGLSDLRPFEWKAFIASVFLVQSWSDSLACAINCPGWSLSDEAFFYLVFPVAAAAMARRSPRTLFAWAVGMSILAMMIGAFAVRALGQPYAPFGHVAPTRLVSAWNPLVRLPEFLLGALVGMLALKLPPAVRRARAAWSALGVFSLAVVLAMFAAGPDTAWRPMLIVLLPPVFALLIMALANSGGWFDVLLANPLAVTLGEMSYSLYILHYPIIQIYTRASRFGIVAPATTWGGLGMELFLIFAAAYTAYAFVERPARGALRRRFGIGQDAVRHSGAPAGALVGRGGDH